MYFDGTNGVRFHYNGKEYAEVIIPECAEPDPDLEGIWMYRLDTDDENLSAILYGSYDGDGLQTTGVLQVRVHDSQTDKYEYIDDIDVIGADDVPVRPKVWIMTQESNVDGEIYFNVVVCKDETTARKQLQAEKEWVKNESRHFKGYNPNDEYLTIEESETRFFIMDNSDDYYEDITIEEKEII